MDFKDVLPLQWDHRGKDSRYLSSDQIQREEDTSEEEEEKKKEKIGIRGGGGRNTQGKYSPECSDQRFASAIKVAHTCTRGRYDGQAA